MVARSPSAIASRNRQRIIGITGGIATGKTTTANYLGHRYHLPILDADVLARQALTHERLVALRQRFGESIFQQDGSLDRRKLGQIIFAHPPERQWLEALIHPFVRDGLMQGAQAVYPRSVVMVVPLLFEANFTDLVTEIWVVTCPPEVQLQRLIQRNQLSPAEAQARIAAQLPISQKISQADVVIDSNCPLAELYTQLDRAYSLPLGRREYSPKGTEDI